jgi:DNA-binding response OmpR family regulator
MNGMENGRRPKAKILVVDDQMAVALMMIFLLTRAGCEAEVATNAEKALRLAQSEVFDLITLDVGIPDLDGFRLFQKLRQIPHLKETPVVFVSGNSTIENQQHALDLGAVDFIEKPFDAPDFVSRILSWVKPEEARPKFHPFNVSNGDMGADAKRLCHTTQSNQ